MVSAAVLLASKAVIAVSDVRLVSMGSTVLKSANVLLAPAVLWTEAVPATLASLAPIAILNAHKV